MELRPKSHRKYSLGHNAIGVEGMTRINNVFNYKLSNIFRLQNSRGQ